MDDNSNTNAVQFCFYNFIIVIVRCVGDGIFELFSDFRELRKSMHKTYIVEITLTRATPTMLQYIPIICLLWIF